MRILLALAALIALLGAVPASAGVTVMVRGPNGLPVADAVVTVHLIGRPTPVPSANGNFTVEQKNIQFHPFVLVVPVDANVGFPNLDAIRHHVYSFSPAKRFELKLYAREQSRTVRFDKAGIVALGCNIHDQMTAFIDVVDTPWAAKTDASGNVVLNGMPSGQIEITVWHPYLRTPTNTVTRQIQLSEAGAREAFTVTLRSPPRMTGSSHY